MLLTYSEKRKAEKLLNVQDKLGWSTGRGISCDVTGASCDIYILCQSNYTPHVTYLAQRRDSTCLNASCMPIRYTLHQISYFFNATCHLTITYISVALTLSLPIRITFLDSQ